jgi:hypothetical protein
MGEILEAEGRSEEAAAHYGRFLELRSNAEAELLPHVRAVRERMTGLREGP